MIRTYYITPMIIDSSIINPLKHHDFIGLYNQTDLKKPNSILLLTK